MIDLSEPTTEEEIDDPVAPEPGMIGGRLGSFIRSQRKLKALSQRELARLTHISDPYVSQLERGLHQPSARVLKALAQALEVQVETMLSYAGLLEERDSGPGSDQTVPTELAIRTDSSLTQDQKEALLTVYRSYVRANSTVEEDQAMAASADDDGQTGVRSPGEDQ